MNFPKLFSVGIPLAFAVGAFGQSCKPGSVELDFNMQCACVKNPNSEQCEMYKRNKSMYDGKGIQIQPLQGNLGTEKTAPAPAE